MTKWLAAAVLAMAPLSWAEQKPDFSGTWKLDPLRSRTDGIKEPKDLVLKIEHKGPAIHVSMTPGGEFELNTDGTAKELTWNGMPASATVTWDAWKGNHLVVQTRHQDSGAQIITTRQFSLGDKGKILTTVLTIQDGAGERKGYEFFTKQ